MNKEGLMKVLLSPVISEKSANAADAGRQYLFQVNTAANKRDIRRAVELMFDVKVERVQVINVKGKAKRFGRTLGKRPHWKKAYVRLQEGQDIDFATGM
jgi:large subunit ribosomal protein L23